MPTCAICICRTRALSKWPPDLTDPEWTIGQQQKRRAVGILAHDRLIVVAALILAVAIGTFVTISGGGTGMSALKMTAATGPGGAILTEAGTTSVSAAWSWGFILATIVMWWLMMTAMMVPSAAPAVLLYAALTRGSGTWLPGGPALALLSGYLLAWAGFSLVATALQWALTAASQLSPMFLSLTSRPPAAALLLLAGVYQFTPLKARCLRACNSPAALLVAYRPRGLWGSLQAGLRLGQQCMGCCWALMLLLFVGGAMNLYWIIGLALIVAAEKLLPQGPQFGRGLGLVLIIAGASLFGQTLI